MSTQHTPGPWKLCFHLQNEENDKRCPCGTPGNIWGGDGEHVVCSMGPYKSEEPLAPPRYERATEIANARLIAAAPELLLACEGALNCLLLGEHVDKQMAIDYLREAIAKAERGGE